MHLAELQNKDDKSEHAEDTWNRVGLEGSQQ